MPRRRHDSSDDSDSSNMASPEARPVKQKTKGRRRQAAAAHESDASDDEGRSKSSKKSKKKQPLSGAESSPVKKSLASKVEKNKDKDKKKSKDRGNKRHLSGEDAIPDKKRAKGGNDNNSKDSRGERIEKDLHSPPSSRGRGTNDRPSRRDQGRDGDARGFRSPDRNPGRSSRQEERTIGQFLERSPPRRGRGSDEGEARGYDDRGRGYGQRNEARSRSNDRGGERRSFGSGERGGMRSRSPQDRFGRSRNDSWRSDDQNFGSRGGRSRSPNRRRDLNISVSPDRRHMDRRDMNRSMSPDRRNMGRRDVNKSLSPDRRNTGRRDIERSVSPDKRNTGVFSPPTESRSLKDAPRSSSIENGSKSSSQSKKKKSGKKKGGSSSLQASDSEIPSPVKESSGSKKNKTSKKKRDESIERSFERSKLSLSEENLHSGPIDELNISKESPKKAKKTKTKRRKSRSDSESASPDRSKKQAKSDTKLGGRLTKKSKKQKAAKLDLERVSKSRSRSVERNSDKSRTSAAKKTLHERISLSRSPSPLNVSAKSADLNRSAETGVGKNHDMAKFESEPESGELTDSDEEGEKAGRQQVPKSTIKKPSEEELQKIEDEKYWEEKRRASRKVEAELMGRGGEAKRDRDRGSKRKPEESKEPEPATEPAAAAPAPKKAKDGGVEALTGRTGGAYIPPARLRAMQANITDKSSVEYQRISWEALKKSINGLVNKVNVSNIEEIVRELFQENIVRGRGLMARSIIQAQAASPTFTHVYAALVAIVNTKFPQNGELILKRLVQQFRRGFRRNDKAICLSSTRFIAHLVNQQVAHEVLALEILTLLLESPTDDAVEVSIGFLKESGHKLTDVTPRGINAIFERLRNILHEGQIETRVQYMVEVMFAVRKDGFKDNPAVGEDLDLVEEEDQFTHLLTLEDVTGGEELLNVFRPDPNFLESEEKYKVLKREILDEGSSDEDDSGSGSGSGDSDDDSDNEEGGEPKTTIIDTTETNMVALRRTIYLTIQSSLDFEECAHKLMKMELKPGQEVELCNMILDCCAQMRTYEKFFGLLAGRFCMLDKKYVEPFQAMFQEQYSTIHRLETNKLRNVAKFFAHLLHTDSVSWAVLHSIKLNEEDTTSASRIFIKILFQELSEYLGLPKLNDRLKDPTLQEYYAGLIPRDNPRDTRFAINFFTTIGLGGLTDDLRDHLKSVSKKLMEQKQEQQTQQAKAGADSDDSSDASDSSSSDSSDESSSSSGSSDSDSSEDERRRKKKKKAAPEKSSRREPESKKGKGKSRPEPDLPRDKRNRKDKNRSNGAVSKPDKKKDRKDKKGKDSKDDKNAQVDQFKRLAKLANYGNDVVEEMAAAEKKKREKEKKEKEKQKNSLEKEARREERRERKANRGIRSPDREPVMDAYREPAFERDNRDGRRRREPEREPERELFDLRERDRLVDPRGREGDRLMDRAGDRAGFERRRSLDRYDSFEGRDERDRSPPRRGRKGRDYLDDDAPIQVERNFARMDVYEDKFARERELNLEYLRGSREFEDYFRGREGQDRGEFRDRPPPPPPRGRSPRDWDDRRMGPAYGDRGPEFDRGPDRGLDEPRRRGRNRSEDRGPIIRDERRRRR